MVSDAPQPGWLETLVIAIVYSLKAGRGEWADYPVLGKLARKMLKNGAPRATLTRFSSKKISTIQARLATSLSTSIPRALPAM
jgi:hypothetical protein